MVYIPSNVTAALALKEGEDVEFFKFDNRSFLLAKKSDIVNMLNAQVSRRVAGGCAAAWNGAERGISVSEEEIAVLRKLDTIKYNDRTAEKLKQILSENERKVLKALIARKVVSA